MNSEKIPDMIASAASAECTLIKGNYNWNAFTQVLKEDNYDYNFRNENTILVSPGETITITITDTVGTRRLYEVESINYYDPDDNKYVGDHVSIENPIDSYSNRYKEQIVMPSKEGTYYYYLNINFFEKGKVEYAFKVVVSVEPNYSILDLINYKGTSLLDTESIQAIINILPYSKNITSIFVKTSENPTKLAINYTEFVVDRNQFNNNVIAIFALIPELDIIECCSNTECFYFSRDEMEFMQGRNLLDYAQDAELWEKEVLYKEKNNLDYTSFEKAINQMISSALGINSGDKFNMVSIDGNSFKNEGGLNLSDISIRKIYNLLMQYYKNVLDISLENYIQLNYDNDFIMVKSVEIPGRSIDFSGDTLTQSGEIITKENLHNIEVFCIKDKKEITKKYELYSENGDWVITETN